MVGQAPGAALHHQPCTLPGPTSVGNRANEDDFVHLVRSEVRREEARVFRWAGVERNMVRGGSVGDGSEGLSLRVALCA